MQKTDERGCEKHPHQKPVGAVFDAASADLPYFGSKWPDEVNNIIGM